MSKILQKIFMFQTRFTNAFSSFHSVQFCTSVCVCKPADTNTRLGEGQTSRARSENSKGREIQWTERMLKLRCVSRKCLDRRWRIFNKTEEADGIYYVSRFYLAWMRSQMISPRYTIHAGKLIICDIQLEHPSVVPLPHYSPLSKPLQRNFFCVISFFSRTCHLKFSFFQHHCTSICFLRWTKAKWFWINA
jgi:hypothetical protein